jgi:hypothetical protein
MIVLSLITALNHQHTTSIVLDETPSSTTKNLAMDYKTSRQSSTSSNNLLKPDIHLWGPTLNDIESTKIKSQSLSNIAGKIEMIIRYQFFFFVFFF